MDLKTRIEQTILLLPEVVSCRVEMDHTRVAQIYAFVQGLPSPNEPAARLKAIKGIVRSIRGVLAGKLDINLDYRKIKLIDEVPEEKEPFRAAGNPTSRVKIVAAYLKRTNPPTAAVELEKDGVSYQGVYKMGKKDSPLLAIFFACKEAIEKIRPVGVELQYVKELKVEDDSDVVVAKVRLSDPEEGVQTSVGAAEVAGNQPLAVAKAVLAALNRQLRVS
ncbi:MAG: hypothetical protein ACM3TT_10600 [Syntrophothermus sp.]